MKKLTKIGQQRTEFFNSVFDELEWRQNKYPALRHEYRCVFEYYHEIMTDYIQLSFDSITRSYVDYEGFVKKWWLIIIDGNDIRSVLPVDEIRFSNQRAEFHIQYKDAASIIVKQIKEDMMAIFSKIQNKIEGI